MKTPEPAAPPEAPPGCPLCPRLVAYRLDNQKREPLWCNNPIPSFGDGQARLLIVGLAPGRTGANRTGRPFTGDHAGWLLYGTLLKTGFASGVYEARPGRAGTGPLRTARGGCRAGRSGRRW